MESGAPCDSSQSLKKYLDNGTINATGICYEDKQYFLVQPAGSSTKGTFSAPVGLDMLNQGHWDGITRDTLITGSLRTYAANGNQNGGVINLKERNTLLDLFYGDITTPGFMRLPVCTSEQALQPWRGRKPKSNLYYPCAVSDKNK
ncbi:hypothetical protein ESCO_001358 [Escovopsis weberi]|uniref:Uncharacterized protein n=1 Tax=Escovopsis weberi TaxID=150374 RepID=A0A0M8N4E8_ESCWE|nr:hypothetical protein ESCO_001358 [Escovopsis weberi]